MTNEQKAMEAITHVKRFIPETVGMMIRPDGRWFFFDLHIKGVAWTRSIDTNL